jgi:hypothetical protein
MFTFPKNLPQKGQDQDFQDNQDKDRITSDKSCPESFSPCPDCLESPESPGPVSLYAFALAQKTLF